ncbi:MAG: toll/interleukin-1 receptor domain-containing protein [Verrucomicrobia bacterium]|nr:toll/interleukin-1 receptor domain-containing protein [Verrucomicrobiota bacterium]
MQRFLKTNEINLWVDQWNIPLSSDWEKCIDDALERCTKLLVVLSKASVNSDEFRAELRQALDGGKSIIPVLYKECKTPRRLTLIQNVDFTQATLKDMSKINQLLSILRDDMEYDWSLF